MDINRLMISFDRLTRFKNPAEKYLRVYKDILMSNLISPKYKKSELELMDFSELTYIAETIINTSIERLLQVMVPTDYVVNARLKEYEKSVFNIEESSEAFLDNKINYDALIKLLPDNVPLNLKWLKLLADENYSDEMSHCMGYHFPIKKLVICEGITEEILLPVFADIVGYNFDNNGVYIISAGGKNQVVKLFYELAVALKIPIFVLLDSDAEQNYNEILPRLREADKIYLLSHGEFEDILSVKLIEKALKYSIENISDSPSEKYQESESMVDYLENFYKTRGVHEFKKAEFAQIVKKNVSGIEDVSEEFVEIIHLIKNLKK